MAAVVPLLGAVSSILGTAVGAVGTLVSANQQAAAAEAQAAEAERRAKEERAAASREAFQRDREAKFTLSRLQARAAGSGGSATDSTVARLAGDIASQGAYQTQSAVYEGAARGQTLEFQADEYRREASAARTAGLIGFGSTILGGISNFAQYRPAYTQPKTYGYLS